MAECSRVFPSVPGTAGTQCSRVPLPLRGNREQVQCPEHSDCSRPLDEPEAPAAGLEPALRADPARRGRRSRLKGKRWERELAALLRPVFGDHVARGFQTRSGRDGCDVEGTPFWLEAKHGKLVNVRAALRQALEATDGRPAVVVAKDDRSAPMVVMKLADWLDLAGRAGPVLRTAPDGEGGSHAA